MEYEFNKQNAAHCDTKQRKRNTAGLFSSGDERLTNVTKLARPALLTFTEVASDQILTGIGIDAGAPMTLVCVQLTVGSLPARCTLTGVAINPVHTTPTMLTGVGLALVYTLRTMAGVLIEVCNQDYYIFIADG